MGGENVGDTESVPLPVSIGGGLTEPEALPVSIGGVLIVGETVGEMVGETFATFDVTEVARPELTELTS